MVPALKVFFQGIAVGGSGAAVVLLIVDYIRLRRAEYVAMQAAKAVAALAGVERGICTDNHYSMKCSAFRSPVCSDGRCREHCRDHCRCKGNR